MAQAVVIGGGPAGLMAAQALAQAGLQVTLAERMPSLGRKFLMAGKSGLNLTREEPAEAFLSAYEEAAPALRPMLAAFGPAQVQAWARGLGRDLFTGSTGRVFPVEMKASPLLRAWLGQLGRQGVRMQTRWHWQGFDAQGGLRFQTPEGAVSLSPDVTVLACGGASWPRLGSDGGWAAYLPAAPFRPANCGFLRGWSPHMEPHFGAPLKAIALRAAGRESRGEIVLSRSGIEGGGIYMLSRWLREGAALTLDLLPDLPTPEVAARLARARKGESLANRLRKTLKLDPAKRALLQELARPLPEDPAALAALIKALPLPLDGPAGLETAISVAGGVPFTELTPELMLKRHPGVFAAGEMLDWEAPTGGYLLTGCLATGLWAGQCAAQWQAGRAAP